MLEIEHYHDKSRFRERAQQTIQRNDLNRGYLKSAHPLPPLLMREFVELLGPSKPFKLAVRVAFPEPLANVHRRMYHAAD